MIRLNSDEIDQWLVQAERLWLFLDYDGTVADFAPVRGQVTPDREVVDLLARLSSHPTIRVAVISGRRLSDVQTLLPVQGIYLGGVYGLEVQTPDQEIIQRAEYQYVRQFIDRLKLLWEGIVVSRPGFYLEDKDWSLALHTPVDGSADIDQVLSAAQQAAGDVLPVNQFHFIGGTKFLEAAPVEADKGKTVGYLLSNFQWPDSRLLYIGDDDQDVQAFEVIHSNGGITILVSGPGRRLGPPHADLILPSPQAVRRWLQNLAR